MAQRFQSLELIAAEVHDQLQIQLRHFDSLDTKAGIVLGFSGALVALAGRQEEVLSMAGLVAAGLVGLTSVLAFLPRAFPVIDVKNVRVCYSARSVCDPGVVRSAASKDLTDIGFELR